MAYVGRVFMSEKRVFTLLLIILKCVCVKPRDFLTFCITAPCLVFFLFCFPACLFWCSALKSLPSSAHKTLRVFHYFVRFFFNTLRPRPPPILPVPHTPNPAGVGVSWQRLCKGRISLRVLDKTHLWGIIAFGLLFLMFWRYSKCAVSIELDYISAQGG